MAKDRFCAYCLKNKCRCGYRAGRRGKFYITCHNTTAQATMGEMKKAMLDCFGQTPDETLGTFSISFTKLDKKLLAKAQAKEDGANA